MTMHAAASTTDARERARQQVSLGDPGDAVRGDGAQLRRPANAVDPRLAGAEGSRHRRSRLCAHRPVLPDRLRRFLSRRRLGHGQARREAHAGAVPRLVVARQHGYRLGAQRGAARLRTADAGYRRARRLHRRPESGRRAFSGAGARLRDRRLHRRRDDRRDDCAAADRVAGGAVRLAHGVHRDWCGRFRVARGLAARLSQSGGRGAGANERADSMGADPARSPRLGAGDRAPDRGPGLVLLSVLVSEIPDGRARHGPGPGREHRVDRLPRGRRRQHRRRLVFGSTHSPPASHRRTAD